MHWADFAAQKLAQRGNKHIIASGITPSGEFHIGHLREIPKSRVADLIDDERPSKKIKDPDAQAIDPADDGLGEENDSFHKLYNKEIKVNQDEIPIILAELTDAAYNFIQRENYEKALILLQKTEGVLEVRKRNLLTRFLRLLA